MSQRADGLVFIVVALFSLWLVVQWMLQVPISGSIMLFVAGTILYQFTVTALGIFLATFTTSMAQFGLLVIPVLMVMNLLSGSTIPMESMPAWLQGVMQISPAVQFVSFSQAIVYRGADFLNCLAANGRDDGCQRDLRRGVVDEVPQGRQRIVVRKSGGLFLGLYGPLCNV